MMPSRLATVKFVKVAMIWLWDSLESIQKPSFMGGFRPAAGGDLI